MILADQILIILKNSLIVLKQIAHTQYLQILHVFGIISKVAIKR